MSAHRSRRPVDDTGESYERLSDDSQGTEGDLFVCIGMITHGWSNLISVGGYTCIPLVKFTQLVTILVKCTNSAKYSFRNTTILLLHRKINSYIYISEITYR